MMKRLLYISAVIIFFLNTAMTCDKVEMPEFINICGIEAFNVNNEKEYPFISDEPVKKEAYMIGIKWIFDENIPDANDRYLSLNNIDSVRFYCKVYFDEKYPADSDVTNYFINGTFVHARQWPHSGHSFVAGGKR